MLARVLCCAIWVWLASPALAIDITTDTVWREGDQSTDGTEIINIYGNATLTVEGPGGLAPTPSIVNHIHLHDSASFVLNGGNVRKSIYMHGEDTRIDLISGRFGQSGPLTRYISGEGSGTINLYRDTLFGGTFHFPAGEQVINVFGMTEGPNYIGATLVNSPGAFVNAYSQQPIYNRNDAGTIAQLHGFAYNNTGPGWGGASFDIRNHPRWLMYPIDGRPDGDTNGDFVVDLQDLNNVRNHFGGNDYKADTFPMDGIIDLEDLNRVRNQFGMTSGQPVPEPSSIVILVICAGLVLRKQR